MANLNTRLLQRKQETLLPWVFLQGKIVLVLSLLGLISIARADGQNISVRKTRGLYNAYNIKLPYDSVNYVPCGHFRPSVVSDTVLDMFSLIPASEFTKNFSFSVKRIKFTDRIWVFESNRLIAVQDSIKYLVKVKQKGGKVFIFEISKGGEKHCVRRKYEGPPDQFVQGLAEDLNRLALPSLSFEFKQIQY